VASTNGPARLGAPASSSRGLAAAHACLEADGLVLRLEA
jgi:hypothetical protein